MKVSIIVPVFNEESTVAVVLEKLAKLDLGKWDKEIIVIDDGSQDSSKIKISAFVPSASGGRTSADRQNIKLISHDSNRGKGEAIKTALQHATGNYVIIQDADLEYDPHDIPVLLSEVEKQGFKAVFGSRNLKPQRRGYPHYVLGVKVLTIMTNFLYRSDLTDVYTGYKLIATQLLKSLNLQGSGFEFEAEVTAKILKKGVEIKEVPIHYNPRTFSQGKKIGFWDGLLGAWTILKERL